MLPLLYSKDLWHYSHYVFKECFIFASVFTRDAQGMFPVMQGLLFFTFARNAHFLGCTMNADCIPLCAWNTLFLPLYMRNTHFSSCMYEECSFSFLCV